MRTIYSERGLASYPNRLKQIIPSQPNQRMASGKNLTEQLVYAALDQPLALHHAPQTHHSQDIQYLAHRYVKRLQGQQIQIRSATKRQPFENAFAERLIRTLKEEEIYLNDCQSFQQAQQHIGYFLQEVYMYKRIHSALAYLTPAEFEAQYAADRRDSCDDWSHWRDN